MTGLRCWAALLTLCLTLVAQAATPLPAPLPALTGRVVDTADMIPPQTEAALTRQLAALEAQSSDQLVIVTIPGLEGADIADYAYALAQNWQIGQQGTDNGIILLVALADRQVRIEVGRGLEGTVTDAMSGLIIREAIVPAFRAGDYAGGISAGVDALSQVMLGDAAEWQARAAARPDRGSASNRVGAVLSLIFIIFIMLLIMNAMSARRRGVVLDEGGRRVRRGAAGSMVPPVIIGRPRSGGWGGGGFGGFGGGGFGGGGGGFGGGGASGRW